MAPRLEIVQPIPTHAKVMNARAREEDVVEWHRAAPALSLLQKINLCVGLGQAYTILADDEPVCMFGVNPGATPDVGTIWLIATERGNELAKSIHKQFWKQTISKWSGFKELHAHAWDRNESHVKWLKAVGFKAVGPSPVIEEPEFTLYVYRPR